MLRNPFITGAATGAGVVLIWCKRETIAGWFRRASGALSGVETGTSPWQLLWTAMRPPALDERPLAKVLPIVRALPAMESN